MPWAWVRGDQDPCRYCREALVHPPSGRPRNVCPSPDCQRQAATAQKRRRRHALAGLPAQSRYGGDWAPLPTGGRDKLLRKYARLLARQMAPHVTATSDELAAIELAFCTVDGFDKYRLRVSHGSALVMGIPKTLPRKVQGILRTFVKRNDEARLAALRAALPRRVKPKVPIVGTLPEPFSRPGRARGATSRDNDRGWLDLPAPPPKPRISLPSPEPERELSDLPEPFSRPGRARGATSSRDNDMAWLGLPVPPTKPRITPPPPEGERELIDLPIPKKRR